VTDDYQHQQNLEAARIADERKKAQQTLKKYSSGKNKGQAQQAIKTAKDLAKNATPWGIFSLLSGANPFSDWMYGLALFAAILKDLLDLLDLTGIGYLIVFIATICCSAFIAMMMLLGSITNGTGRAQQKMIRSWLILLGGTTVELIFGIDILPIETITVLIVYFMLLSARKTAEEQQKREARLEEAQEAYA
jgi:hypothetical protein